MKKSCLQHLVCAVCKHDDLAVNAEKEEGLEIMEGTIKCACGANYPIIAGVPRMLVGELLNNVLAEYSSKKQVANSSEAADDGQSVRKDTMDAFGFEWSFYSDYDAETYNNWMPKGIVPEEIFRNKVGLEVGCGAGRHAATTAQWAAVHYAVDLSFAVDSAFQRTRHLQNCHIVQADAFNLPFKEKCFDYVYCLGVLQHMHQPGDGFSHLARQPHEGGILLVNVYQSSRPVLTGILEALRKITVKMPLKMLNRFCFVMAVPDYAIILAWKALKNLSLGRFLDPVVPQRIKVYSQYNFKTVVADWFDRLACPVKKHYSQEDLASWYEKEGYKDIRVTPYWKSFWNGYGVKS